MHLRFFLDKTAERSLFSIEVKDPEFTRKRVLKVSFALMGFWMLCMWINVFWGRLVPMYVSFPFAFVAAAMWYFVALIDDERRREKAEAEYAQLTAEAHPHE